MKLFAGRGPGEPLRMSRLQTDSGLSAECVRTGEVLLCSDAESNPRVDWASCRRMGVRSILVAPLRHFRRTLGVFEVLSSTAYAFDNNDVATMQFLSGMMVATISAAFQFAATGSGGVGRVGLGFRTGAFSLPSGISLESA
jgi:GAF domain-containing protein